jgi:hypothetical protein
MDARSLEAWPVKYLMLINHAESYRSQPIPEGLMAAMGEFVTAQMKRGVIKETAGLKATSSGFRVRSSGGRLSVTDGPFTETKEVVGGFAIAELKDGDEALDLARQFMELHRIHWPAFDGTCEVRPYEDM